MLPPVPWTTVVGIVGDVRHAALQADPEPEIYVPQAQDPSMHMYVVVRSEVSAGSLVRAIAEQVQAIDKTLPIFRVESLDGIVDTAIAAPRMNARLIAAVSVIAVLLALGGTYGVVSYAMSRRTREIGVRLALGATPHDVMQFRRHEELLLTYPPLWRASMVGARGERTSSSPA
jgi:putative ABC transport system permease protein